MHEPSQFPATVLRAPSPTAVCTCEQWAYCNHECHHRDCDPTATACDIGFLPDDGGLTAWGCRACTPGEGAPHYLGCDLIGWSVPVPPDVSG